MLVQKISVSSAQIVYCSWLVFHELPALWKRSEVQSYNHLVRYGLIISSDLSVVTDYQPAWQVKLDERMDSCGTDASRRVK